MNSVETMTIRRGGANRARKARLERGTSLIEILVVLVILLVGIFLAVRVFPNGFGILRSNSNRTLATQFAQQQLSELKSDAANLPQGILFSTVDPATGGLTFSTNLDPDNLGPCRALNGNPCTDDATGTAIKNTYFSDVNKFRYIKGEGVKVPLPTVTGFLTGSLYAAKFGPMFMNQQVGDPNAVPTTDAERKIFDSYLRVSSAPMIRVNVDADEVGNPTPGRNLNPNSYLRGPQTYLIDYGNSGDGTGGAAIYLPTRAATVPARAIPYRTFSIILSYETGGGVTTAQADPITVNDDEAYWRPITVGGVAIGAAVPGSETVTRNFNRLAMTTDFEPADPYQYKLLSPNVLTNQTYDSVPTYANVGIIAFNPSGANYSETGTNGQEPFKAYLDYAVLDWHILRDNREVPSVIPDGNKLIPLRTTLGFIKKAGAGEADTTIYRGLYGNDSADLQVFNLSAANGAALTPGKISNGTLTPPLNPVNASADYYVNDDEKGGTYRTGTIYINPTRVPVGSKLRILYKAEGDWAVAVQKAYNAYRLNYQPGSSTALASFPLKGRYDGFSLYGKPSAAEIRLPLADFNRSFIVTLQYTTKDGKVQRLAPIQMTAGARGSAAGDPTFPADGAKDYDDRWASIKVVDFLPFTKKDEFVKDAATWQIIGSISGVSVKSRVIWRDVDAPENRWRLQDVDSYMTAGQ